MPQHIEIPYYSQWLGLWAMLPDAFLATFEMFRRTDLHLHMAANRSEFGQPVSYREDDGNIAIINLTGNLMKQQASLGGGTSTVQARRDIRSAAADSKIAAIMLRIDSPGGTAAGTQELADEIAAANLKKRTESYIEDLGASAAYWSASQAIRITANPTGLVGSIGTYGVIEDYSGYAAKEGVKVHVVRAGDFKGAGTPGTEVTPEQLADMQRIVDGLNDHFIAGVAKGRRTTQKQVREWADGRVHLAADAKNMGLIDAVGSFDDALSHLQEFVKNRSKTMIVTAGQPAAAVDAAIGEVTQAAAPAQLNITVQTKPIKAQEDDEEEEEEERAKKAAKKAAKDEDEEEQKKSTAATYAQLVAGCVGADPAFLCAQLAANATLPTAQSAWMAEQNKRIEAAKQSPGVQAVGTRPSKATATAQSVDGGAIDAWNSLVESRMQNGQSKADATRYCVTHHQEEHLAFLAAHNARFARA